MRSSGFAATRTNSILLIVILVLAVLFGAVSYQYTHLTTYQTVTTIQVQTASSTVHCGVRQGAGWAFYIKVVDDATGKPVSGVKINALAYTHCGDILDNTNRSSLIETGTVYSLLTPSNGTVYLSTETDGYFFTVFYAGQSYPFETFLPPELITNATVSVPSGNLSIAYYFPPH